MRSQATDFSNSIPVRPLSIDCATEGQRPAVQSIQLDTQHGEGRPADKLDLSRRRRPPGTRMLFATQPWCASPERFVWCKHSKILYPNVVSIGRALLGTVSLMFVGSCLLSACLDLHATRT